MIFHKFAVLWTISISSSFHDSTAFVVSPSTISSSILRRNKSDSSHTPFSTITITHATPKVSFISLEQGSNNNEPSKLNSEQLNALTDAALGSNSTAASILLREINDAGENGSVVDKLLHLVDKGDGSNDNSNSNDDDELQPGKGLPLWTKVRISAKFSKRARRASLRRVLDLADSTADDINGGDNTRRRNALVLVLRVIAQANISVDDDVGTGIWDIERDARKERKNNIQDIISSFLEQPVLKVEKTSTPEMDSFTAVEESADVLGEKEKVRPISAPIEESSPTLTELESRNLESRNKFNEESKVLARTIEKKVDAIQTERARVQKIADRNKQLEAERRAIEEKEAAAIAAEQLRLQAIVDRNQQIEDEKRAEKEKEERLKIANEKSAMKPNAGEIERARVQAILDRNEQIEAEKRASLEIEEKEAASMKPNAGKIERARVQAILDRNEKIEAEKRACLEKEEEEAAAIAAEHASAQVVVNERNQRALLNYHLELDAKTSALEAEKRAVREAAVTAAEQAKEQSIANERNQRAMLTVRLELDANNRRLEAEKMAEREREEADIAAALEQEAKENRLQLEATEREKAAKEAEEQAKKVIRAEKALAAALEQEAKENRLQLEAAEREKAANVAEVEETSTDMPKVENEPTKEDKIQVRRAAISNARKQPKNKDEEKTVAEYYGGMDLEERAFTILYDLGMIEKSPDPDSPDYNHDLDDEFV